MKWPFGLYGAGMHDYVLREIEVGPRAALCEDAEACGDSALADIPDRPVPYVLTPQGEAAAAEPDTWTAPAPDPRTPEGMQAWRAAHPEMFEASRHIDRSNDHGPAAPDASRTGTRRMSIPDLPEGFQGAGPMFAAVPLGDPWYNLAARGAVTYIPESADAQVQAAFLDRGQAEQIADAQTGGELGRWTGLCGWNDVTPARAEAERQAEAEAWGGRGPSASYAEWLAEGQQETGPEDEAERQAEYAAEWETEPEWDDADSSAYHARVEAGLEPEAG